MASRLDEFLLNVRAADVLDVLTLSVVIAFVWRWLHRRATRSIAIALAGLGALYVISQALSMYLTVAVFQAGLTVMLFALVVIFQDDLRHAVERISTWRLFSARRPESPSKTFVDTLVEAVTLLAGERIGALIVLPGRQPLDRHIRGGVAVGAFTSIELLHSIFHAESRGHDGGVIIRNERVEHLGVHLPLSANLAVVGDRGTRHAAALGLAERTDALVIVVSEERASMSLAMGTQLLHVNSAAELEGHLVSFFETQSVSHERPKSFSGRFQTLCVQLGSFTIAAILWFVFAFRIETVQRTIDDVPVEFRNLPEAWVLEDAMPKTVQLTLVGPERAFAALDQNALKVAVDLTGARVDRTTMPIRDEHLRLPQGISLREADPPMLRYQLGRQSTINLPVRVVTTGHLPNGWKLLGATAEPASVAVRVLPQQRRQYGDLPTEPVDLSDVRESKSVRARIQLPQGLRLVRQRDADVQVQIEILREPPVTSTIRDR